jgi:hypothetical protein
MGSDRMRVCVEADGQGRAVVCMRGAHRIRVRTGARAVLEWGRIGVRVQWDGRG